MGCNALFAAVPPAIRPDAKIETRIEKILGRLTLEEKIGQMCQLTVSMVTDMNDSGHPFISDELLDTVIGHYKVGSILNVPFDEAQSREAWTQIIGRIQRRSLDCLGIPCIYGVDQMHGASYTRGATFFPQGINMGAALNCELMRRSSEISAYETRACAIPWNFAPVMDLGRDPRWSRMWESYGEDVCVNSRLAAASVRGLQGDDPNRIGMYRVAACLKHFMAYGVPVSGKDRTPSSVTRNALREKYFAPFLECIRAGALSLMVNSSNNDGMPFHANRELLTGWLKEELNWDGVIVTDWNDIYNLYERDHIAESRKDAVRIAINAGIDMAMVPLDRDFCVYLRELVEEGLVSERRIDDAVRRILRLKMRCSKSRSRTLRSSIVSRVMKSPPWLCKLPKSRRCCSKTTEVCYRSRSRRVSCSPAPMPIPCAVSTAAGLTPGRVSVAMSLQIVTIRFTRPWRVNSIMLPGFQA